MAPTFLPAHVVSLLAAGVCAVLLSGCSSVADVSGTVKNDGQPLPDADLVFTPADEQERVFYALSVKGGKFQVDYGNEKGMPPGNYKITVTWYSLPSGEPLPSGEAATDLKNSGNVRTHTKEFSREISAGHNKLELDVGQD